MKKDYIYQYSDKRKLDRADFINKVDWEGGLHEFLTGYDTDGNLIDPEGAKLISEYRQAYKKLKQYLIDKDLDP